MWNVRRHTTRHLKRQSKGAVKGKGKYKIETDKILTLPIQTDRQKIFTLPRQIDRQTDKRSLHSPDRQTDRHDPYTPQTDRDRQEPPPSPLSHAKAHQALHGAACLGLWTSGRCSQQKNEMRKNE